MGIFDALTTAVSGLQAQSFALQNISGNIANSQTVGYKETDTAFDALVSQAALGQQTSGGVFASSVASNGVQGTIQNETVATDMAINGQGYFVVTQPTGNSGTNPQFSGVNDYTRRGDFQMDSNGYLVNGAGYYLMGIPVNPATGAATSSSPQVLQFNNNFLPAQATSSIDYAANLPSAPPTGVLNPANYTVGYSPLDTASGTVIGQDATTFTNQSLDGGSITAYDSLGNPVNVQLRWAETASAGGNNSWQLFYQTNTNATGTQVAWQNVGTTFTFNSSGQLTSPAASSLNLTGLAVNGDTVGNVTLNYGGNLTQFASSTGSVQVNSLTQNGFGAGSLQSLSVAQGQIVGSFSNGQTVALADVTVATFNGQDSLQSLNGEAFAATPESGNPNFGGTGTVVGSSLEASNVDIATQFSQLIVAQQAYSANARVMTTADQMIQSLLTVIQ
ncbi:MAG TPA: flagellar hook protein FlgE [Xanthobacteraceae bacterium]|nr:flagellar hook protein FlgE [Xanthobacteraceae bacterium]